MKKKIVDRNNEENTNNEIKERLDYILDSETKKYSNVTEMMKDILEDDYDKLPD